MDSSVNLSPLLKGRDTDFVLCYFGCDVLIVGLNVLMNLFYQTDFLFFNYYCPFKREKTSLKDISYS